MRLSLLLLLRHPARIFLRQPSPDRACLLGSEVEWEVLLVLVEDPELRALVGVDDGQDFGDRFAEVVNSCEF